MKEVLFFEKGHGKAFWLMLLLLHWGLVIHASEVDSIRLSNGDIKGATFRVMDHRSLPVEFARIKKNYGEEWQRLYLRHGFVDEMELYLNETARDLSMGGEWLMKIESCYLHEIRFRGNSLRYGSIFWRASIFKKEANDQFRFILSQDTTIKVTAYILIDSMLKEFKSMLRHELGVAKFRQSKDALYNLADLAKSTSGSVKLPDAFSEGIKDGIFYTWEQVVENKPELSEYDITGIKGLGNLILVDSAAKRTKKLPLFSFYAFYKQGILYKCSRFGAFKLLRIGDGYYYKGFSEEHFTFKPQKKDTNRRTDKGGIVLSKDDIDSQQYLFKLDPLTGKSLVVCHMSTEDNLTDILLLLQP